MKFTSHLSFFTFLAAALLFVSCNNTPTLDNRDDTLSWALGENVGQSILSGQAVEVNNELFLQAIRHTLDGKEQPISDTAYNEAMSYIIYLTQLKNNQKAQEMQNSVDAAQQRVFEELTAKNPNIKRHPSGFYYEELRAGKGPNAKFAQRIKFDYRSYKLLTGEPFDQTYGKREPIIHVVGNPMFPGLIEGFQLMNAGSIYRFYFPYQLVFGEKGSGSVPGYTPLIYEIELHEVYKD